MQPTSSSSIFSSRPRRGPNTGLRAVRAGPTAAPPTTRPDRLATAAPATTRPDRVAIAAPATTGPDRVAIAAPATPPRPPPATVDAKLIAIIDDPGEPGETVLSTFTRKEASLRGVLAGMAAADARVLHRRLKGNGANDVLVAKFGRLSLERRQRLLSFLADARRREAIAAAGRR